MLKITKGAAGFHLIRRSMKLILVLVQCFGVPLLYAKVPVKLVLIPENPRPGEPVTVGMTAGTLEEEENPKTAFQAILVTAQGQRLTKAPFFNLTINKEGKPFKAAILAVPCTARPGSACIQVEYEGKSIGKIDLTIENRSFVSEEIPLDQANTALRTVQDPQKTAEAVVLWGILSRTGTAVYTSGPFTAPVTSTRRTSFFGDRRVFMYVDGSRSASIHGGVDYGVPRGTEVRACAAGKVVLARSRIVTGNSVIIEHLPGVYSLYYHLDHITVQEGVMVNNGTVLGQSGATGLATGPHLHWEIRVAGENTDPDAFVSRPILDKDALLGKIK
ncbi:MAG: M23 family metallopeptidase [Treponema sp.]|jgi:murein DD-endopeptidase MepM/ murein hydrolase activator NlpD|nr:M23 family metallopeptidase [Treponema sp.]